MTVPRPLTLLPTGAGLLLILALVIAVAGYVLAPNFYLTRTIFWRESDYKDLEKFPARTIHNAPPLLRFDKLPVDNNPYASQIEAIASDSSNGSLEDYLDAS